MTRSAKPSVNRKPYCDVVEHSKGYFDEDAWEFVVKEPCFYVVLFNGGGRNAGLWLDEGPFKTYGQAVRAGEAALEGLT